MTLSAIPPRSWPGLFRLRLSLMLLVLRFLPPMPTGTDYRGPPNYNVENLGRADNIFVIFLGLAYPTKED